MTPRELTAGDVLAKHVRALRKMDAEGFTLDVMIELAFGGQARRAKDDERPFVVDLYRKGLPKALAAEIAANPQPNRAWETQS